MGLDEIIPIVVQQLRGNEEVARSKEIQIVTCGHMPLGMQDYLCSLVRECVDEETSIEVRRYKYRDIWRLLCEEASSIL